MKIVVAIVALVLGYLSFSCQSMLANTPADKGIYTAVGLVFFLVAWYNRD